MSERFVTDLIAAACPWLAAVLGIEFVARRCGCTWRPTHLVLASGAAAAGALLVPVAGIVTARWIASVTASFSVPLTAMAAVAVLNRSGLQPVLSSRDWMAGWSFGAIGGLVLYPPALGMGSVDPYEWGWGFSPLFVAIAVVTGVLLWTRSRFGVLLLIAAAAYRLQLLESGNYWDYLLDPIYCMASCVALGGRWRERRRRVRGVPMGASS